MYRAVIWGRLPSDHRPAPLRKKLERASSGASLWASSSEFSAVAPSPPRTFTPGAAYLSGRQHRQCRRWHRSLCPSRRLHPLPLWHPHRPPCHRPRHRIQCRRWCNQNRAGLRAYFCRLPTWNVSTVGRRAHQSGVSTAVPGEVFLCMDGRHISTSADEARAPASVVKGLGAWGLALEPRDTRARYEYYLLPEGSGLSEPEWMSNCPVGPGPKPL